jgi:hypothetical protein
MALTRKFLSALGIEAEKIDEIIEAHTDTVNALKEERDKYKKSHESLPAIQKELDDLKKAAEQNGDNPYKAQYEELKKEYDDYKADVNAKELSAKKKEAYSALLKKAGVSEKRIGSIVKVSQFDDVELDNDGNIKGAEDLEKKLKEEWKDFIVTEETHGAETKTPPEGNGGGDNKPSRAALVAQKHYEQMYGKKGENK